jgi:hypothetical protein
MPVCLAISADEQKLHDQAAGWSEHATLSELGNGALRIIAAERGLDFATAVLYDRLLKSDAVTHRILHPGTAVRDGTELRPKKSPSLVAVVPGAFYVESPRSGADGREILDESRRLGVATELIPTRSFGSLDENAEIIRRWLGRHARPGTTVVSLSKGGADVKWALRHVDAELAFRHVRAWINISGITEGTPLVSWLLGRKHRSLLVRPLFRWRNYDFDVLRQLDYGEAHPLNGPWNVPPGLSVIHVLGFPLKRHLTNGLARRGHRRLAGHGPNDGAGIVLYDAVCRPGMIYPVWGADHYLHNHAVNLARIFRTALTTPRAFVG